MSVRKASREISRASQINGTAAGVGRLKTRSYVCMSRALNVIDELIALAKAIRQLFVHDYISSLYIFVNLCIVASICLLLL